MTNNNIANFETDTVLKSEKNGTDDEGEIDEVKALLSGKCVPYFHALTCMPGSLI